MDEQGAAADEEEIQYPFFTEGTNELLQARVDIARYSLLRAKARVGRAKLRLGDPDEDPDHVVKQARKFVLECSEIGDDRPLTGCSFSRDASMLATSSLSGIIKVWSMAPQITKIASLKGHTERATDVAFSPVDNNLLATASADKTAKLWNSSDGGSLVMSFDGHLDRLARLAFHPSGKYLGTASFDRTWRLWDVNTGTQLLLQEGHSRGVYGVGFHPDGSLAASCGLDAHVRVWDLRSGRLYCTLTGHERPVLGVSFSPDGHLVATAGEDCFCRIWDLRTTTKMLCSTAAHKGLISQVRFEPREGGYLATSSYDTRAALWSTRDYRPIRSLAGHESRVTGLDISGDGKQIVTVSHDRTIKMWSCSSSTRDDEMQVD